MKMNDSQTTRRPLPLYQPNDHHRIPLVNLLSVTTTNSSLLGQVVTVLQEQAHRYLRQLECQAQVYSINVRKLTICHAQASKPDTTQIRTIPRNTTNTLEQEADSTLKGTSTIFTTVDSEVYTQTVLGLSTLKSITDGLSLLRTGKDYYTLLELAWSCYLFLWKELRSAVFYPPVTWFLKEASKYLCDSLSGTTTTMDLLISLFEDNPESIKYLYRSFSPLLERPSKFAQRFQQITQLLISTTKYGFHFQKTESAPLLRSLSLSLSSLSSLSPASPLAAYKNLIRSFEVDVWLIKENPVKESHRQLFYNVSCEFIRFASQQVRHEQQKDGQGQKSETGGMLEDLVRIYRAHMMKAMGKMLRLQKGQNQLEHLYLLDLILDTMASGIDSNDNSTYLTFATLIDEYTETLGEQNTPPLIVSQEQWYQEQRAEPRLERLNSLDNPLQVLHTLIKKVSQHCAIYQGNALQIYGFSVCMALTRLVLTLLMDRRVPWNLALITQCFDLFWSRTLMAANGTERLQQEGMPVIYLSDIDKEKSMLQRYMADAFGLTLELLIREQISTNACSQSLSKDLLHYFHYTILDRLDSDSFPLLSNAFASLSWQHLPSTVDTDHLQHMTATCLALRKRNMVSYSIYSRFIFHLLQKIMTGNSPDQQHLLPKMEHASLVLYVELTFICLINAEVTWPDAKDRLDNLQRMWLPVIDLAGKLDAHDMTTIVARAGIGEPSNWQSSLETARRQGNGSDMDQHILFICIQWLQHLTVVASENGGSMDLIACFGRFIMCHLASIENTHEWVYWLKVLFSQANEFMTMHSTSAELDSCSQWFQELTDILLEKQQQNNITNASDETKGLLGALADSISASGYNTSLAMFVACTPPLLSSPLSASSLDPAVNPTQQESFLNSKLLLMESCLEHCFQLADSHDVWIRTSNLIKSEYLSSSNNANDEAMTSSKLEMTISEYTHRCMQLSCLLVLNVFCRVKLHQPYMKFGVVQHVNKDHLVAEEVAAILSLLDLIQSKMDPKGISKVLDLIHLFAGLLSRNKLSNFDLWLPGTVSLARTCSRWLASAAPPSSSQPLSSSKKAIAVVEPYTDTRNEGIMIWQDLVTALESFLTSRLALLGVTPYTNMVVAMKECKLSLNYWIKTIEEKKRQSVCHKRIFSFTLDVVQDLEGWSVWELDDFLLRIVSLSDLSS